MTKNTGRRSSVCAGVGVLGGCLSLAPLAAAIAQQLGSSRDSSSAQKSGQLEEIVVTAGRREVSISKAPYNVSAYGGDQIAASHISTVAELSREVPNFTIQDTGARASESSVPIIRGLNASQASGLFEGARNFQSPVGMYLGNSPMIGSLPLMDVERVEVLRGPQGTLYGAGTLAGAVRIVPVEPRLGGFSGEVNASVANVSHSDGKDFDVGGTFNLPLSETTALRLTAKRQRDAGFVDQHDVLRREGNNYLNGLPILENPGDIAGSPGVYFTQKDANWDATTAVRAQLLWMPTSELKLDVTYNYARVNGNGGPLDNHVYKGGPSPTDPRRILAPTGEYEISAAALEPFERKTHLGALDASYDMGFATLSGSFSFGRTNGSNVLSANRHILGIPVFTNYYAGNPINPRLVFNYANTDKNEVYTEEIRLVSNGAGNFIDFVAGAFFQQQNRELGLFSYDPGSDAFTYPAYDADGNFLGDFPIALGPDSITLSQITKQKFREMAAYGNVTFNLTPRWQVTGGARLFHETFKAQENENIIIIGESFNFPTNSSSVTKPTFMLNTSYELSASMKTYATWSQGYRRGGANAFPTGVPGTGICSIPICEAPELIKYNSDTTNNFEVGLKGRAGAVYFSAAVFYTRWSDPQIDLLTPYLGYSSVVNGRSATTKGVELEMSGPLGSTGLSFNLGFAYSRARLSEDFTLPAADGTGGYSPNGILGKSGDRLPGAPDYSGSASLTYATNIGAASRLTTNLGVDYRGSTINDLTTINPISIISTTGGYAILHASVGLQSGKWNYSVYANNLTNRYVIDSVGLGNSVQKQIIGNYGDTYYVGRPREMGLRVSYEW